MPNLKLYDIEGTIDKNQNRNDKVYQNTKVMANLSRRLSEI